MLLVKDKSKFGSGSALEGTSKEEPLPQPQGHPQVLVEEAEGVPPHSTATVDCHLYSNHEEGTISELILEELASRLVSDALSRAVQQCYLEKTEGRQVRVYYIC